MISRPAETTIWYAERPFLLASIVFLLAAILAATLIWRLEEHRLGQERARVASLAGDHAYDLQRRLDRAFSATYALAALVREGHGGITDFDGVARQLLPFYPGVAALQLAPGGVIRQVVPLAGNETAIGHDLLKDTARDKEARFARDSGQLTLAGPFTLVQGGAGAVARLPVFMDDKSGNAAFWGFTTVLIRFPAMLDQTLLPQLIARGFGYELWRIHPDTGEKQVIASSAFPPRVAPVKHPIQIPNGTWTLSVAPLKGWGDPVGLLFKASLGLLFSLLLAWLARLLVEFKIHEAGLEEQVRERTAEIEAGGARLRESEFLFRSQFDLGNIGIAITTPEKGWLRANGKLCRMLGCIEEELLQRSWADITHPDDLQADLAQFQRLLSGEIDGYEIDKRFIRKDGEIVYTHMTLACCRNDGQLQFIIASFLDITERVRAEKALGVSEKRFRDLLDNVHLIALLLDADGKVTYCNNFLLDLIGFTGEEMLGADWFARMVPDSHRAVKEVYLRGLKSGDVAEHVENPIITAKGALREIAWNNTVLRDAAGAVIGTASIGEDITERKRTEKELRSYRDQLEVLVEERTRELEEAKLALMNMVDDLNLKTEELAGANERLVEVDRLKSLFIASMSHELRTPLNSVIGFSSILLNEWIGALNDEQKKSLTSILRSGRHLLTLINDVIDVSKIEAGIIEVGCDEFDLAELLAELEQTFVGEAQERGLSLAVQRIHLPMCTDRRRLLQCLLNLVSNAIKFTERGAVTVAVRHYEERGEVGIDVTDTGIGIGAADQPRLFQAFSRIQAPQGAKVQGTGLGLYLTKKIIVDFLRGSIGVASEAGNGSRFSITIPSRLPEGEEKGGRLSAAAGVKP